MTHPQSKGFGRATYSVILADEEKNVLSTIGRRFNDSALLKVDRHKRCTCDVGKVESELDYIFARTVLWHRRSNIVAKIFC